MSYLSSLSIVAGGHRYAQLDTRFPLCPFLFYIAETFIATKLHIVVVT